MKAHKRTLAANFENSGQRFEIKSTDQPSIR